MQFGIPRFPQGAHVLLTAGNKFKISGNRRLEPFQLPHIHGKWHAMTYKLQVRNALLGERYTWHVYRCGKSTLPNNAKAPGLVIENRRVIGSNRADKMIGEPLETIENTNRGVLFSLTHVMYVVEVEQSCHVLAPPLAASHNLESYFSMYVPSLHDYRAAYEMWHLKRKMAFEFTWSKASAHLENPFRYVLVRSQALPYAGTGYHKSHLFDIVKTESIKCEFFVAFINVWKEDFVIEMRQHRS